MLRLLTTLLLMSVAIPISNCGAEDAGEVADAGDPFQRGLRSYQSHDYPAALARFNEAIERGPVTARLLHNVALTEYQMNKKPLALAYWRKALAIDPNFAAARTGRELLENRMHMRPFERDGVDLRLRQGLEFVPAFGASWALALFLTAFAWAALRYLTARRRARDEELARPAFPVAASVSGVLVLASATLLGLKLGYGLRHRATVVAEPTNVRSLPDERSVALFEVAAGGEVLVRRTEKGWSQVQNTDGSTGWVRDSEIIVTSDI